MFDFLHYNSISLCDVTNADKFPEPHQKSDTTAQPGSPSDCDFSDFFLIFQE